MLYDQPDTGPTRRSENDHGDLSGCEVLLVPEIGVSGDKYLESLLFGRTQQLAVLQGSPTKFISGGDAVACKCLPQRNRRSLVEQDAHLCGQQSGPGRMFQDMACLRQGNTWEPFDELVNRGIFLKVFKERSNRNSRTTKDPGPTQALRVTLNIGTRRPINHREMVALIKQSACPA